MTAVRTIIFAKVPRPGFAKTRLVPALGPEGAARLAERMLKHTITEALSANVGDVELCVTPDPGDSAWQPFHDPSWCVDWQAQGDGDLGARLARAAHRALAMNGAVLLIGADCPALTAERLREAVGQLASHDAVIIPSTDGGYILLGLRHFHPAVFHDITWSTGSVAFETLCRIGSLGWTVAQMPGLLDIDEPVDLDALPEAWQLL